MTETIKHAAVIAENGMIFIGKCHADCLEKMHHMNIKNLASKDSQGFMTNQGKFVQRHSAFNIAAYARQVRHRGGPCLYSEDLWDPDCGGRFNYCEIRGYYE